MMEDETMLDTEWEDFDKLMTEHKRRRMHVSASPVPTRRHSTRQKRSQSFYPCPPPTNVGEYEYDASSGVSDFKLEWNLLWQDQWTG